MRYLTVEQVISIHESVLSVGGGDPAILDRGKLESDVARPRMTFGGEDLYATLAAKAAALAFSLNKNHPFRDGNKRTSHAAMEVFLLRNDHEIEATVDEQERVFLGVASGRVDREEFTGWVEVHMIERRHGDRPSHEPGDAGY